jgi:5-methylcytosine-specific restriction endonuclease McrA
MSSFPGDVRAPPECGNCRAMNRDGFLVEVSEETLRRERAKARELRGSQWWKRRCSDGICHYCGKKVGAKNLTMDHLVPLVRGGRSNKGNLVPACKDCNTKKKYHLAFEWSAGGEPS